MPIRKNFLSVNFNQFNEYAEQLEKLNASIKDVFTSAMEEAGKKIADDTEEALANEYLPAKGRYSTGATKRAIIRDPKVEWSGPFAEMGIGFDKTRENVGSLLITGTPKMKPDMKLQKIYMRKYYEREIVEGIEESLQREINRIMKG